MQLDGHLQPSTGATPNPSHPAALVRVQPCNNVVQPHGHACCGRCPTRSPGQRFEGERTEIGLRLDAHGDLPRHLVQGARRVRPRAEHRVRGPGAHAPHAQGCSRGLMLLYVLGWVAGGKGGWGDRSVGPAPGSAHLWKPSANDEAAPDAIAGYPAEPPLGTLNGWVTARAKLAYEPFAADAANMPMNARSSLRPRGLLRNGYFAHTADVG